MEGMVTARLPPHLGWCSEGERPPDLSGVGSVRARVTGSREELTRGSRAGGAGAFLIP